MHPCFTAAIGLTLAAALVGAGRAESADRLFTIVSVEQEMDRHIDETPFPDTLERHPDLTAGGGYRLDPPNDEGEWHARAYLWHPVSVTVSQGDNVTLEFFGINGDEHPTRLEGYDLEFVVRRGEITRVAFTADRPGIFPFVCGTHQPTMTGQLVVLAN
jgi:hypothetical protein